MFMTRGQKILSMSLQQHYQQLYSDTSYTDMWLNKCLNTQVIFNVIFHYSSVVFYLIAQVVLLGHVAV